MTSPKIVTLKLSNTTFTKGFKKYSFAKPLIVSSVSFKVLPSTNISPRTGRVTFPWSFIT